MSSCKFCNKPAPNNMQGYCQVCYRYFIMEHKEIYPLPKLGEITYAPNGDCICPFCGKAFRKLGLHFYYSHNLTSKEAHKKAGWDQSAKATNEGYRILMRNIQHEKTITENLLEKGKPTRFKKNHQGRTKDKISVMTNIRLKNKNKRGLK